MKDTIGFNTKMLHALASYGQREILPPISQVSAFSYESMEELERVFAHKSILKVSKGRFLYSLFFSKAYSYAYG